MIFHSYSKLPEGTSFHNGPAVPRRRACAWLTRLAAIAGPKKLVTNQGVHLALDIGCYYDSFFSCIYYS